MQGTHSQPETCSDHKNGNELVAHSRAPRANPARYRILEVCLNTDRLSLYARDEFLKQKKALFSSSLFM